MAKDRYAVVLFLIGLVFSIFTILMISKVEYIGSAEDAGYTLIAKNLANYEGFTSYTVLFFFDRYETVRHPDDTAPPLFSLFLAILFKIFGVSVILAKTPSIIFNCLALPFVLYFLARKITKQHTAFIISLFVMFSPISYPNSVHAEVESMFAFFIVLSAIMFQSGLKEKTYFLLMGLFIGLSFLTKYTGILVFFGAVAAYVFLLITRKAKYTNYFLFGILAGLLVISPWLARNYLIFGDAIHTVNNKGSVIGPSILEKSVFWDEQIPTYPEYIKNNLLLNINLFITRALTILHLFFPFIIFGLFGLFYIKPEKSVYIISVCFFLLIFHIFVVDPRYDYLISAANLLTIPAIYFILEIIPKFLPSFSKIIKFGLSVLVILMFLYLASKFFINASLQQGKITEQGFPFVDSDATRSIMDAGTWAKEHLPEDAVFMVRKPRGFGFYAERPTVYRVPDPYETLLEVAKYYNVSYIECDGENLAGHEEDMPLIYENPGFRLCRFDWNRIATKQ